MSGDTSMSGYSNLGAGAPQAADPNEIPATPDMEAGEEAGSDQISDQGSDLAGQLAALKAEHEGLNGQYMRLAADFDNFRKRQSRDSEDLRLQIT